MGRHEDGNTEIKCAIRLEPYSMVNQVSGFALLFACRYDQAIVQFEEALDLDSSFAPAHWGLSGAYSFKSLHELAIAAGRRAVELSHGATLFVAILGEAFAAAGYRDEARDILEQLHQASKQRYVSPYAVGRIYATLGETDEALRWLEIAYREHTAHMVCLKTDPRDSFSLLDIQVVSLKRDYYVSLACQVDFVRNNPSRKPRRRSGWFGKQEVIQKRASRRSMAISSKPTHYKRAPLLR